MASLPYNPEGTSVSGGKQDRHDLLRRAVRARRVCWIGFPLVVYIHGVPSFNLKLCKFEIPVMRKETYNTKAGV